MTWSLIKHNENFHPNKFILRG